MKRVLCVSDYYLPGFKGGGPMRTLANMCELLAGEVIFSIFTRDRDLGMSSPYPGIRANEWLPFADGPRFYASPDTFSARSVRRFVTEGDFDLLYLNSFFSFRGSISPYLAVRKAKPRTSILLAPRGEFSPGALALKRSKKQAFLAVARAFGLYKDVDWHASSADEAADILRVFPQARGRIHIAADPVAPEGPQIDAPPRSTKSTGKIRIAFVSRISPKKNVEGLLSILSKVRRDVELDLFGPIEDAAYWDRCLELTKSLPTNIRVAHHGAIPPEAVVRTFAQYDLFALPTRGENFGHVIFESLRAGTPVLTSDQTPWESSSCGALAVVPLAAVDEWRQKIEEAADRTQAEQDAMRANALDYARHYLASDETRLDNLAMFRAVAAKND